MHYDIAIIGGGAAGFFTAVNTAENNPDLKIAIFERGKEVLTKVRISGGGRCNVTHAEFLPKPLTENYPRGRRELLGPFHTFMTGDTVAWFEERGVPIKTEGDGRMFPISDSSQTIIDCFTNEAERLGIQILMGHSVQDMVRAAVNWELTTNQGRFTAVKIVVATGSNPKIWKLLEKLGHSTTSAVPSLFTFNIKDRRINGLPGLATEASVTVLNASGGKTKLEATGPLLITHWGMSGPSILKLSAWGARELNAMNYQFDILVNWVVHLSKEAAIAELMEIKNTHPKKQVITRAHFELPKRLWVQLVLGSGIPEDMRWAELGKRHLESLAGELVAGRFRVSGKSTFKEEFVTAGGIDLKEVDFKTFGSKVCENLYFAGEVLDIDAITGGFNFQNAWTGGYIVAQAIA